MYQRCPHCLEEQPIAIRTCGSCSTPYPKRLKDVEKLKNLKTNITQQKKLMEKRVSLFSIYNFKLLSTVITCNICASNYLVEKCTFLNFRSRFTVIFGK